MSFFEIFIKADWLIKLVMLALLTTSFFSWAIILDKVFSIKKQERKLKQFERLIGSGQELEQIYSNSKLTSGDPASQIFVSAFEMIKSEINKTKHVIISDAKYDLNIYIKRAVNKLEHNIDYIATIGSTSPFVGLFGTVWGIMNSFNAIGISKNTSLIVLAPSIAEALMATAAGIFVSIPAFIFYNRISSMISEFEERLELFSYNLIQLIHKEQNK